jgi:hypothetical protein
MLRFTSYGCLVSDTLNTSPDSARDKAQGELSLGMQGFDEIRPPPQSQTMLTAQAVQSGPYVPPLTRVLNYSPDDWESLVKEWAYYCLRQKYLRTERFTGANDKGIDIAGFVDSRLLLGEWDNYQCKRIAHPLQPNDVWVEIGKTLWYSFNGDYTPPRAYYFVGCRGIGPKLTHFLSNIPNLKRELIAAWNTHCKDEITETTAVLLIGSFAQYVEQFDFSIFQSMSPVQLLDEHKTTPCHIVRFGGGLPPRPLPGATPAQIGTNESVYVQKLMEAYSEHASATISALDDLSPDWPALKDHFIRQREAFYHAESLRVFVRDKVEPGTFDSLQEEFHRGVIDTCNDDHLDGYRRVCAVTRTAQELPIDAHPLSVAVFVRDRHGICHQLANDDKLVWKRP